MHHTVVGIIKIVAFTAICILLFKLVMEYTARRIGGMMTLIYWLLLMAALTIIGIITILVWLIMRD